MAWTALAAVWAASALFLWFQLDQGWIPHDEGTLGQSAERVLLGEMPHRDFDELYTGGLTYLNALAFRVFGVHLAALRWVLFAVFLVWIPAVFHIASRFVPPWMAAAVTALAAAWSLPVYPAPLPSWYNLFLATLGIAALLRHLDTGRARWLVLGGAAGGLSLLIKITGLTYLIAAGLYLVYFEATRPGAGAAPDAGPSPAPTDSIDDAGDGPPSRAPSHAGYRVVLLTVTLGLTVVLAALIRARFGPEEIVDFLAPGAAVAAALLGTGWRRGGGRGRLHSFCGLAGPFLAGALAPLLVYAAVFAGAGALDDLWRGVFVTPFRRMEHAAVAGPALGTLVWALPAAALLLVENRLSRRGRWAAALLLAAGLTAAWMLAGHPSVYRAVWSSLRWLIPVAAVAGSLALLRAGKPEAGRGPFLLLAASALGGLVQYPYTAPVYFFYAAPLALLAATAVTSWRSPRLRPVFAVLVLFHLAFGVRWIDSGFIYGLGVRYVPNDHTEVLDLPRGGLRVTAADKQVYEGLVATVNALSPGEYIYVTADAPQVYFLTGRRNPTRTLFDFFDVGHERPADTLSALERHGVRVVVINRWPRFSGLPAVELQTALASLYPHAVNLGHFIVRWRE